VEVGESRANFEGQAERLCTIDDSGRAIILVLPVITIQRIVSLREWHNWSKLSTRMISLIPLAVEYNAVTPNA